MSINDPSKTHFDFNKQVLDCLVGGVSAIDINRLNIHSHEEARQFIQSYGYDLEDPSSSEELWAIHRRAVLLIKEYLIDEGETVPEALSEQAHLGDLSKLLILASSKSQEDREMRRWACSILRVMHVYAHLRNDLFSAFRDQIQTQILNPFQDAIRHDDQAGTTILGESSSEGGIFLHKYEIKPFKTTASSVVKLLARPDRVAMTLFDKLGVRFVTNSVYDSFRVIRFLVNQHIVNFAHIMPDQSINTLYPVNIFLEVMDELKASPVDSHPKSPEEMEALLQKKLHDSNGRGEFKERINEFSGPDHRFIKFINRKLIKVMVGSGEMERSFRFFYPYEIQVMDYETYIGHLSGPTAHDEYKSRQRKKARERVFREN